MEKLTDKEVNCQYEMLMQFDCLTINREAALMLLDEIICCRMKEREVQEAK